MERFSEAQDGTVKPRRNWKRPECEQFPSVPLQERSLMHPIRHRYAMLVACAVCVAGYAAPYVPTDGKQVLETLPARTDPLQQAFPGCGHDWRVIPTTLR
jgi:hypothetical protein